MSETVYAGQSTIQASLFQSVSNTANVQTFTGPGQWTKPLFGTSVMIECWGAGGGGGAAQINAPGVTSNVSGGGGGGGSYASNTFPINFFTGPAYVFVGVGGAGGAVPSGAGGLGGQSNVSLANDSSVAFIRAYGGEGSNAASTTLGTGGIGAGMLGPRTFGSSPAAPLSNPGVAVGNNIFCGGGGGACESGFPSPAKPGGNAVFGGAGGMSGARAPTLGVTTATSVYGGGGGLGGLLDQPGQTGGVRGGGGGGGGSQTFGVGPGLNTGGGQGGRGEVRIFVF
jgi:hypothetical protein